MARRGGADGRMRSHGLLEEAAVFAEHLRLGLWFGRDAWRWGSRWKKGSRLGFPDLPAWFTWAASVRLSALRHLMKLLVALFFLFKILCIYLRDRGVRERERARAGVEGEGEAGSLPSRDPDAGLDPRTPGS